MNKYLVTEEVPYEGKNTWTVFADHPDEAKELVKTYLGYEGRHLEPLSTSLLKFNIRGTKTKGVIKHHYY